MPNRTSLNVSLTPELEQFVQSRVASGLYQTASEVVREASGCSKIASGRGKAPSKNFGPRSGAALSRPTVANCWMAMPCLRRSSG